jgi:hypothetical protein
VSLHLQKNKVYRLSTANVQEITQLLFGDSIRQTHTEEAEMSFRVLEFLGSSYSLGVEFDRMSMRDSSAKGITSFSTDRGDTSVASILMSRMMHKPF